MHLAHSIYCICIFTQALVESKRRVGTQKVFPQKVKSLMVQKESLVVSRRGIVSHFNDVEKPSFSPEELFEYRRRGISFSCIGKKLGIDNTKEEVLNVFTIMKECDASLPDISQIDKECPMVKNFPTPLWFMFDSELEILAQESVPSTQYFLQSNVQERIASRLGERGGHMLANFIEVNEIVKEELCSTIGNSSGSCHLGKVNVWTNGLQKKVISMCSNTTSCIAKSAMHHILHVDTHSVGRCQCGGVKVLKVNWKGVTDIPSFFWGCGRYRPFERFHHDRAVPFRSGTVTSVIKNATYVTTKDLQNIKMMITDKFFKDIDDFELASKLLGSVLNSTEEVQSQIQALCNAIDMEIGKRNGHIFPAESEVTIREMADV